MLNHPICVASYRFCLLFRSYSYIVLRIFCMYIFVCHVSYGKLASYYKERKLQQKLYRSRNVIHLKISLISSIVRPAFLGLFITKHIRFSCSPLKPCLCIRTLIPCRWCRITPKDHLPGISNNRSRHRVCTQTNRK